MIKFSRLAVVVCLWVCFQTAPLLACKYNVRDTGFVDLGDRPYYLFGYVKDDTPADALSVFEQVPPAVLMDSNVRFEIINIDEQKEHGAVKYLDSHDIKSFPAAVLVSADGQSLAVEVGKTGEDFKRTLWSAVEAVVSSPKRDEIVEQISEAYAVILLFEGVEQNQNEKARQAATGAIEKMNSQLKFLPKPIANGPVMVVVSREDFAEEQNLLWSLGLDAEKKTEPRAAIIYGRARWIGPLIKAEQITENILINLLYIIGADCECGLDRRWMQGTMLAVRWDEDARTKAAKNLGFDPESPMIKAEISRIMRMGTASYPGVPLGYQELVVEFESEDDSEPNEPAIDIRDMPAAESLLDVVAAPLAESVIDIPNVPKLEPIAVQEEPTPQEQTQVPVVELALQKPFYLVVGLGFVIVAAGLIIIIRSARKNR